MNFDCYMPFRLLTGRGCLGENTGEFAKLGNKCLIVTSGSAAKRSGALNDVLAALEKEAISHVLYDKVRANPLLVDSKEAGDLARGAGAEFVVGIGGGSALDAAKAAAVFATNDMDCMEIYGPGWKNRALPLILIGTTAGTGSEVAPYAVMTPPDGRKRSFTSDQCYPAVAFGNAAYTDTLPLRFTVSTALDALSHAVEGYYSTMANALSDLYAAEAVRILYPLLCALQNIREIAAISPQMRDELYYASVLAGFTLARTGTCYCHSLGYFLSEEHDVPHGTACAATLGDFLQRAHRLLPEKSAQLYARAGCTCQQLCDVINALAELPAVRLTPAQVEEIVQRTCASKNFERTAPAGYSKEEAVALLTGIFGA